MAVVGIDEIKDYVFKRGEWGGHKFKGGICVVGTSRGFDVSYSGPLFGVVLD